MLYAFSRRAISLFVYKHFGTSVGTTITSAEVERCGRGPLVCVHHDSVSDSNLYLLYALATCIYMAAASSETFSTSPALAFVFPIVFL